MEIQFAQGVYEKRALERAKRRTFVIAGAAAIARFVAGTLLDNEPESAISEQITEISPANVENGDSFDFGQ